ncbi:polysaccharide biosynthesis/export family protein [Larkinella punicea]|uniref:Ligand-binding protein n=1 Tax=Larkinella punicea TaxID=2315727 RepID=A0A368JKQ9_9BACT|nr:polysaccharide biosynthesis/export family protein [Larkinella punicea]RCR67636.1 ligand-binding protein [Larkinella punicea]
MGIGIINTIKEIEKVIFIGCFLVFQLSSCKSVKPPPPQFEYFQSKDLTFPASIETAVPQISKIQKGDILGIIVSSLNKESNEILNFYNVSSLPLATFSPGAAGAGNQPLGYPVDSLGNVSMPLIGKQKLEGLTLQQAEERIRLEVEKTLKDPAVNIRFMNHKFTVLGEVGNVGTFNLLNDQTTLIEAITAAGDLTVYGKRDSITVIRSVKGKREIGKVSLRNREVFTSPYFYVKHDDIIYVEPTKDKTLPPQPQPTSLFVQRAPIYLSLFTTFLSVFYLISRF